MKFHKSKINQFVFSTLNFLGFQAKVSLNNKTDYSGVVCAYVYTLDGRKVKFIDNIGIIKKGSIFSLDLRNFCEENDIDPDKELVFSFGIVPEIFWKEQGEFVDIPAETLFKLFGVQDHFIEYYNESEYSFGVLFSAPPLNHKGFKTGTMLAQLPKIFASNELNTIIKLINPSSNIDYDEIAKARIRFLKTNGEIFLRKELSIPPNGVRFLNIKETFGENNINYEDVSDENGFLCAQAICENNSIIPLVINFNEKYKKYSIEHSMPPIAYNDKLTGETKNEIVKFHSENW